jgi:signal transduction histidine kinase/ActR/RegA family two-component response regulator
MPKFDEQEFSSKSLEQKLRTLEEFIKNSTRTASDQNSTIQRLTIALQAAPVAVWDWDLKDDRVSIDATIAELLEYGDQFDHSNKGWQGIFDAAGADKIDQLKNRLKTEPGYKANAVLNGITKNKKTVPLLWSAIGSGERMLVGTITGLPDLTSPGALQNIPIGLILCDHDCKVLSVNQAGNDILGVEHEGQLQNVSLTEFVPFKEAGLAHYFSDLAEKNQEFDIESPAIRSLSGEQVFLQIRGFERGHSGKHVLMITDISKRKNLEDQYRQLQRLESIGKLAGGIAHDFNNILTVIKGSAALALSGIEQGNPAYDNLYNIQRASERAESLTQQLLAFSRRQLLQPRILDLNELIGTLQPKLVHLLGGEIRMISRLDEKTGNVKADKEQIENVLINLIMNAKDAMPEGGTLTIETQAVNLDANYMRGRPMVKPGSYALLAVSDNGKGMDSSIQSHIFEPFFTTKDKGLGSGMGLATVYGVIKQSSGYIWVYSEVGKGSTFKIYLPQVTEPGRSAEAVVISDEDLKGTETVLVVDDEAEVRALVSEMLRFYGYKVMEAPNAGNALMIFEKYQETIDIILTDVVMPQMSGLDLVERLMPDYPKTRVLFMSGYTDNVITEHGLLDKNRNFIQKPFNAKDLIKKVREILDESGDQ